MKVGMVPSDARGSGVARAFEKHGNTVTWLKMGEGAACDIIVFPMPFSKDGVSVYGAGGSIEDWLMPLAHRTVYGGRISDAVRQIAARYHVDIRDHFAREEEVVLNVIPTVEGALQLAMENTPYTLHATSVLVFGFGRIGKLLSRSLASLGALVTVVARKQSDLAWCQALGYRAVPYDALPEVLPTCPLIFNTVPAVVLDGARLSLTDPEVLIIDLAGEKSGVDGEYASTLGRRLICAPGLPSKVAPRTAGEIICKTILGMHNEQH